MRNVKKIIRWLFVPPLLWASHAWGWIQRKAFPHIPEFKQADFILPQLEILPYIAGPSLWNSNLYRKAFHFLEARGVHLIPQPFLFAYP